MLRTKAYALRFIAIRVDPRLSEKQKKKVLQNSSSIKDAKLKGSRSIAEISRARTLIVKLEQHVHFAQLLEDISKKAPCLSNSMELLWTKMGC